MLFLNRLYFYFSRLALHYQNAVFVATATNQTKKRNKNTNGGDTVAATKLVVLLLLFGRLMRSTAGFLATVTIGSSKWKRDIVHEKGLLDQKLNVFCIFNSFSSLLIDILFLLPNLD